jgi:hypothetical protein
MREEIVEMREEIVESGEGDEGGDSGDEGGDSGDEGGDSGDEGGDSGDSSSGGGGNENDNSNEGESNNQVTTDDVSSNEVQEQPPAVAEQPPTITTSELDANTEVNSATTLGVQPTIVTNCDPTVQSCTTQRNENVLQTPPIAGAAEFQTYNNPDAGVTIQYPPNWIAQEGYEGSIVSFASPLENKPTDKFQEILSLSASPATSQEMLLQDYTIEHLYKLMGSNMTELNLLENEANATLDGNPAYKLVYVYKGSGGTQNKVMEIYTIKDGKVYDITYRGSAEEYPTSLPMAENMINTFKIGSKGVSN